MLLSSWDPQFSLTKSSGSLELPYLLLPIRKGPVRSLLVVPTVLSLYVCQLLIHNTDAHSKSDCVKPQQSQTLHQECVCRCACSRARSLSVFLCEIIAVNASPLIGNDSSSLSDSPWEETAVSHVSIRAALQGVFRANTSSQGASCTSH